MTRDLSRRLPALLLAGSTMLLALLAALQYSSTSRLIRSTHTLQTDAVRASMEEVRSSVAEQFEDVHAWLEDDRATGNGSASAIAERVESWNRESVGAAIETVWMIEGEGSAPGSISRLDVRNGEFTPISANEIPMPVRTVIETLPELVTPLEDGGLRFTIRRSWTLEEGAFIVLPIMGRREFGVAIVGLDRSHLMREWIPNRLAEAAESVPEFELSLVDAAPGERTRPPDVVVPLISGTSRTYEFGTPGPGSAAVGGSEVAVAAGVILEAKPLDDEYAAGERLAGPHLEARHHAGSLDAAWRSAMLRQFGISAAILIVIGCSIVLLVLTARRARRLADQHSAFAAGMSHELRTPVAAIGALADNLQSGLVRGESDVREYGSLIQRERRRLHEMLEGVLAWAEASSGSGSVSRANISHEPVDVLGLLEDEVGRVRETGDADIRMDTSDGPIFVSAHESGLRLILRNVLGNALKHGPARGPVDVGAVRTGTSAVPVVRVRIRDHGPGIPEDERNLVFDAFYRGRRARAGQVPGSGLGLDLVRSVLADFGGTVRLETPEDGGACFVIELPATHAQEEA